MKLSIIIVNYNVKHFLDHCLQSVYKSVEFINEAEIFVVDNNSVDGSIELIQSKYPDVILIQNKENTGFSKANNQAIKKARGEYILLLNPDTVIQENTLCSTIQFMDETPNAGGLGVKMIDGKGNFLPESKRGLPTPFVALSKMLGLSRIFPKSKIFNQYHLGYLDIDKTHKIDVLSGAFMLLRKAAIDKCGLLDETYFMYGEDIDLSYRLKLSGYDNYYFPKTRIIHYKGESTKKSSLNYVFIFYKAMVIFAKKHFSKNNAMILSWLINSAIYFRAFIAIIHRQSIKLTLPFIEAVVLYTGIYFIKEAYERHIKFPEGGEYPLELMQYAVPAYIFLWLMGISINGGYKKPASNFNIIKGVFIGTLVILIIYGLLPESIRFSRFLILLGSVWTLTSILGIRYLLKKLNVKILIGDYQKNKRIILVGSTNEAIRVSSLLEQIQIGYNIIGTVNPNTESDSTDVNYMGKLNQLKEIVGIHRIDEIIFCAKDLPFHKIMDQMSSVNSSNTDFKIAPPERLHIIGSNSINSAGDLYVFDINSLNKPENQNNKRILDIIISLLMFTVSPFMICLIPNRFQFLKNIINVFIGRYSWVGYYTAIHQRKGRLPIIQLGILNPTDKIDEKSVLNNQYQLDLLYAKNYSVFNDLHIIWKGLPKTGRTPK